ncbi:MAG TPA: FtsX-like permease family protein [Rhodanobacteraceae bacterium]
MRHNKASISLIVLQMALTLAILGNAVFLIQQQARNSTRPSGIANEADVLVVSNAWIGDPPDDQSLQATDLAALRELPGVVDAYAAFSYPLAGGGWGCTLRLASAQRSPTTWCDRYLVDAHARTVLDVHLIAGRWFDPSEGVARGINDAESPTHVIVVTHALADRLFPDGNALGQTVYMERGTSQQTIIGIIGGMQTPAAANGGPGADYSVLQPGQFVGNGVRYLIRTRPGMAASVAAKVRATLLKANPARVIHYVRTFPEVRARAYRGARGYAAVLAVICAIMLVVTAFGTIGLTMTWVTQRRREIGIRRALGATRHAILRQFQYENLILAFGAVVLGIGLAVTLNLWMMRHFATQRLPMLPLLAAALVIVLIGQLAVLWPALRAATIPPALAART